MQEFNSTKLQTEIAKLAGASLIERLQLLTLKPKKILDLSKVPLTKTLKEIYPDANYNLDPNLSTYNTESMDLIIANLSPHWLTDPNNTIQETHRILKPEGALLFTTLGPDTLFEIRQILAEHAVSVPLNFYDMHDLGDALLKEGFSDPVVDLESIHLESQELEPILALLDVPAVLTPKINTAYQKQKGYYQTHIELIYAIAHRVEAKQRIENNEISIPLSQIKKNV